MGALSKCFLLLGVLMTGKLMDFLFCSKTLKLFSIINRHFETSILSSHKALGKYHTFFKQNELTV